MIKKKINNSICSLIISFNQVFPFKLTKLYFFLFKFFLEIIEDMIEEFIKITQKILRYKKF
jgi:hypothetical protein